MALSVRRSVRNTVIAIIVLAAAFQLLVVPWSTDTAGMRAAYRDAYSESVHEIMLARLAAESRYAPLWSPPVPRARVRVDRFALQLGGVATLLLLWVAATRPRAE